MKWSKNYSLLRPKSLQLLKFKFSSLEKEKVHMIEDMTNASKLSYKKATFNGTSSHCSFYSHMKLTPIIVLVFTMSNQRSYQDEISRMFFGFFLTFRPQWIINALLDIDCFIAQFCLLKITKVQRSSSFSFYGQIENFNFQLRCISTFKNSLHMPLFV